MKLLKRWLRWQTHELKWWWRGDTRCSFQKLIDECRMMSRTRMIYNPGKCDNPEHDH